MKIIDPAKNGNTVTFRGVSTLDYLGMGIALLFLVMIVFTGPIYALRGHSILDRVDPTFDPDVVSKQFGAKYVTQLYALPDGKILAYGQYNSYNETPVKYLIRLNADGSLDTTFNTETVTAGGQAGKTELFVQPDGKIVLKGFNIVAGGQAPKPLIRFNSDGTLDTGFAFTFPNVDYIAMDATGRFVLSGAYQTPQGLRNIIRINGDGSLDSSFNAAIPGSCGNIRVGAQGNKAIVACERVYRLNENGSEDMTFTPLPTGVAQLIVQPDNKILYYADRLRRLNENGGEDITFQGPSLDSWGGRIKVAPDGKIISAAGLFEHLTTFRRFLPDGTPDPAFTPYMLPTYTCFTVQPDGKIVAGDQSNLNNSTFAPNNFTRLTSAGALDPTFNPGGLGFQVILPGSIRAIEVQADGKILLGGKFDVINDISRTKLARLNADSTVDTSFQINTSGTGDYFLVIRDVYRVRAQSDGKVVVSGWFDYFINGAARRNLVRLNSDGSIDPTFDVTIPVPDYSVINGGGDNPFSILSDGKVVFGGSRISNIFEGAVPKRFTVTGALDGSFTSGLFSTSPAVIYIDDLVIQPDGKIVVAGSYANLSGPEKTFVARLNSDGSKDLTFNATEETGRLKPSLALLGDGKILVARHLSGNGTGRVSRLESDGSTDSTFHSELIDNGVINALLALPDGKIFVGGKFTVSIDGETSKNLMQLDADGHPEPPVYDADGEVLCLALDSEGRLLVGGSFTTININGAIASRSYVARLTGSTQFDFDGDGKADLGLFRPSSGVWYQQRSSAGEFILAFGTDGDRVAAADYDGDGRSDIAVYRNGDWWYINSSSGIVGLKSWGTGADVPLPSDFDADGKADFIYYRPSTGEWFRSGSAGVNSTVQFGIAGDIPVVADIDGDGKADPTIFRPSTGTWWYRSSVTGIDTAVQWGASGDIPVPGDYDGDGKTDTAIFRPSSGLWYVLNSGGGYTAMLWGMSGDRPVAADYDGDGRADIGIYRPSSGVWFIMQSTAGFTGMSYGIATDKAIENAFLP